MSTARTPVHGIPPVKEQCRYADEKTPYLADAAPPAGVCEEAAQCNICCGKERRISMSTAQTQCMGDPLSWSNVDVLMS